MRKLVIQLFGALKHAEARLNSLTHNYEDTDFTQIRDAISEAESALQQPSKETPVAWVELFNLGEDSGVTFPVAQVHGCGGPIDRVQLAADGPFYSMPVDKFGEYTVNGTTYHDICCTAAPMPHLVEIDPSLLGLVES